MWPFKRSKKDKKKYTNSIVPLLSYHVGKKLHIVERIKTFRICTQSRMQNKNTCQLVLLALYAANQLFNYHGFTILILRIDGLCKADG